MRAMQLSGPPPNACTAAEAQFSGPLDCAERLELLLDPGSFRVIRSAVLSRAAGRRVAGDGVVAGAGTVAARPVFAFAQDSSFAGGSLGAVQADTIVRVLQLAREAGAPVVGLVESG